MHKLNVCTHQFLAKGNSKDIQQFQKKLYRKVNEVSLSLQSESLTFPYLIEHCVLWARNIFITFFTKLYDELNSFMKKPKEFISEFQSREESIGNAQLLRIIKAGFLNDLINNFSDCVDVSIDYFGVSAILKKRNFLIKESDH